ncbi:MAG: hypothetical protein M3Y21_12730, partial [Candidatus Eremiobacteraeota bacterium]|nr:hypothetical protein [Candidatus Eremiobacteraeota bacterium]
FFTDVKAARDEHAMGHPCMKSASFGTRTNVSWHGWTSPDLSCPTTTPALSALAQDVRSIIGASAMTNAPRMMHLPVNEPRRAEPPATSPPSTTDSR